MKTKVSQIGMSPGKFTNSKSTIKTLEKGVNVRMLKVNVSWE